MRKPTALDWLGASALWLGATFAGAVVMEASGVPDEIALTFFFVTWAAGVVGARIWWLRRAPEAPEAPEAVSRRDGLTTGEMTAQRLADMEARIYELEERIELAERLLARAEARPVLPLAREVTPV